MTWGLRLAAAGLALAYAAWLAMPLLPFIGDGSALGEAWTTLAPSGAPRVQGIAVLFVVTFALFALGGLAAAAGLGWAPGLFCLGFVGETGLRLLVLGGLAESMPVVVDLAARTDALLRPVGLLAETAPISLAGLLAVGFCVLPGGAAPPARRSPAIAVR